MVNNFFTISWNSRKVSLLRYTDLITQNHDHLNTASQADQTRPSYLLLVLWACVWHTSFPTAMFFLQSTIQKLLKQSFIYCHLCVFVNHHPNIPPSNQQTKETKQNTNKDRFPPSKKKSSPGTYNGTFFGNFSSRLGAFKRFQLEERSLSNEKDRAPGCV